MQLTVPHFKQDTDYSCAPAVLHMLTVFYGRPKTARYIKWTVNIDPDHGVKNDDLVSAAGELHFDVFAKNGGSVDEIKKYLDAGTPVVANYIEPETNEGHYSLIIGYDDNDIIFNDPLFGPGYRMPIREFEKRWKSGYEDRERWLMVVTPKSA